MDNNLDHKEGKELQRRLLQFGSLWVNVNSKLDKQKKKYNLKIQSRTPWIKVHNTPREKKLHENHYSKTFSPPLFMLVVSGQLGRTSTIPPVTCYRSPAQVPSVIFLYWIWTWDPMVLVLLSLHLPLGPTSECNTFLYLKMKKHASFISIT